MIRREKREWQQDLFTKRRELAKFGVKRTKSEGHKAKKTKF